MKHTKGKAESNYTPNDDIALYEILVDLEPICAIYADLGEDEAEANAELIAEAFNVTNECGITPRQLLEQRNEMLNLLKIAHGDMEEDLVLNSTKNLIGKAIKNAKIK